MSFSSEAGAIAARTASNTRSSSASLIALSVIQESNVAEVICFQISRIVQIVPIGRSAPAWLSNPFDVGEEPTRAQSGPSVKKITFAKSSFVYLGALRRCSWERSQIRRECRWAQGLSHHY